MNRSYYFEVSIVAFAITEIKIVKETLPTTAMVIENNNDGEIIKISLAEVNDIELVRYRTNLKILDSLELKPSMIFNMLQWKSVGIFAVADSLCDSEIVNTVETCNYTRTFLEVCEYIAVV